MDDSTKTIFETCVVRSHLCGKCEKLKTLVAIGHLSSLLALISGEVGLPEMMGRGDRRETGEPREADTEAAVVLSIMSQLEIGPPPLQRRRLGAIELRDAANM